jgi:hypothetical protein
MHTTWPDPAKVSGGRRPDLDEQRLVAAVIGAALAEIPPAVQRRLLEESCDGDAVAGLRWHSTSWWRLAKARRLVMTRLREAGLLSPPDIT